MLEFRLQSVRRFKEIDPTRRLQILVAGLLIGVVIALRYWGPSIDAMLYDSTMPPAVMEQSDDTP